MFARAEAFEDVGTLTRIGCIGPFEVASSDQANVEEVLYLRTSSSGADDQVYRFQVAPTFEIELQVTERPQVVSTGDQRYRVEQVWQPSIYSSTSVILFIQDPADPAPAVIYGLNVSYSVVGDAIGEYRLADDPAIPEENTAGVEVAGLNSDLTVNGLLYILVDVYTPSGTTSNGFMTIFATDTQRHSGSAARTRSASGRASSFSSPSNPRSPADRHHQLSLKAADTRTCRWRRSCC